jgi:cold shock CspA family protein
MKILKGEKVRLKKKKFIPNDAKIVEGIFNAVNDFGFVTPMEGGQDLYIYKSNTLGAKSGEMVKAMITKPGLNGKKDEAEVVEIIE